MDTLDLFHPQVQAWFFERFGRPTEVQEGVWREVADGKHVLLTAPTGSGKTLAAFLWALDSLFAGRWEGGKVRVLYVSPLKALNADIRENLLEPLNEIRRRFKGAGEAPPEIRVMVRSGDSPAAERRSLFVHPPEILITTPESLAILLVSPRSRALFEGLRTLILDEIHSVAGTKRGVHLAASVERLVRFAGEFQRIAVSATVRPLETIAEFVGGWTRTDGGDYRRRPVSIVKRPGAKTFSLSVEYPQADFVGVQAESFWSRIAEELRRAIEANKSTIVFVNTRVLSEKLVRLVNEGSGKGTGDRAPPIGQDDDTFGDLEGQRPRCPSPCPPSSSNGDPLVYAHHGSLSKEIRRVVERRLREGRLRGIVATSSLELGIDIGALDEAILVQTPTTVSSALQRIGRAGHAVGAVSRGRFYPTGGQDLVRSVVMARAVAEQDIEETRPPRNALDVLAQVVLAWCAFETWMPGELYDAVRCIDVFHELPRALFDGVVAMLEGRYERSKIRELAPRLYHDRESDTLSAMKAVPFLLYQSGGTIPDRGYYSLKIAGSGVKLGELDEEFVWERRVEDAFTLGAQSWRIVKIDEQSVEVVPAGAGAVMSPFWKAERNLRDFRFSERLLDSLEDWNGRLDDPSLAPELESAHSMKAEAAHALIGFLRRQRAATGAELPHRHHLLIEEISDPDSGREDVREILLHTMWGGRVNQPFAMILSAWWEEQYGYPVETFCDDDGILVLVPHSTETDFFAWDPAAAERLLRRRMEGSGFFGARFRENAGRALLLPRGFGGKRIPLWFTRLKSKRLYAALSEYPDFPILLETWRVCLRDEFDLATLFRLTDEVRDGTIRTSRVATSSPSPFCSSLTWRKTNQYLYAGDEAGGRTESRLDADLLREAVQQASLRPDLPSALAGEFDAKLARSWDGYAPDTREDLLGHLAGRVVLSEAEWGELEKSLSPETAEEGRSKLVRIRLPGARSAVLCSRDNLDLFGLEAPAPSVDGLSDPPLDVPSGFDAAEALFEFLKGRGPLSFAQIEETWGYGPEAARELLEPWRERGAVLIGALTDRAAGAASAEAEEVCETRNWESLVSRLRRFRRKDVRPRRAAELQLFLAESLGLCGSLRGTSDNSLEEALPKLYGLPLPAALWEEEILPARLSGYRGADLDKMLRESGLAWTGGGKEKTLFFPQGAEELFLEAPVSDASGEARSLELPARRGRFTFWDLKDANDVRTGDEGEGIGTRELSASLWAEVWKGRLSSDGYEPLRRGLLGGFEAPEKSGRRVSYREWRSARPVDAYWFPVGAVEVRERDLVDESDLLKERARIVLGRYGIVFRELLEREAPPFQWKSLFPALRLMELSGEALSGFFFEGLSGLQFMLPGAFDAWSTMDPEDSAARNPYWFHARDPVSAVGLVPGLFPSIEPAKLRNAWFVFRGAACLFALTDRASELVFASPEARIEAADLAVFHHLVSRPFHPLPLVSLETIGGVPAAEAPQAGVFEAIGFKKDYRGLVLHRTYR